jgi:hypothetical protein
MDDSILHKAACKTSIALTVSKHLLASFGCGTDKFIPTWMHCKTYWIGFLFPDNKFLTANGKQKYN